MLFFYALYFTIHPIQPNQVKTQVAGIHIHNIILSNLKICLVAWFAWIVRNQPLSP